VKIPYIAYIFGLILGGLVLGSIADHSGRKMILLGKLLFLLF
jgi:MFS family permease